MNERVNSLAIFQSLFVVMPSISLIQSPRRYFLLNSYIDYIFLLIKNAKFVCSLMWMLLTGNRVG